MIKRFSFVFESIILPYIISINVKLYIFCDDYCLNFYINNQPLGHIDPELRNALQEVDYQPNLREDEIETISADVKNQEVEGGLSLKVEIGDLSYSTNLSEYWKWNQSLDFSVVYGQERIKTDVAYLRKGHVNSINETYRFTFTIPKLIKLKNFEINISKNKQFSFPLGNHINKTEQDIESIIFTQLPDHGIISFINSGTINIGQGYGPKNEFEYKKNKDINLKNVLGNNNIIDHITIYIKGKNKDLSNKATIYLIYCYKYEDVINYNIDITHCNSKYFNSCNSLCIDSCTQEGMVLLNKVCYLECPEKYSANSNDICIANSIVEKKNDGISYVEAKANELMDGLEDTFKIYKDLDAKVSGENFYFEIVSPSDKDKKADKKNISSIDFGECENILKEKYQISEIYVAKIDIITSDPLNQVEYMAFDSEGNKLDLDYCKGQKITVEIPLKNNADMVSQFSKEGIDILNPESPFYNDRCFPYKSEKGDIILKSRREMFYQGTNIEEGCSYTSFNDSKVNLQCEIKTEVSSERHSSVRTFKNELLDSTNLMLIVCYKRLTLKNLIKNNCGFWICGSIFFCQIILFIYFSCCGFQKFMSRLLTGMASRNPPKMREIFEEEERSEMRFNVVIKNQANSPKKIQNLADSLRNTSFNEALNTRNPFKIFCLVFLSKIELYTIVFAPGFFDIISLSLSLFLLSLVLDFGFNAFFFSDDIISQKFENGGEMKTATKLILPILSNVIGGIVHNFFQKLGSFTAIFELLKGEKYEEKKYLRLCNRYLKILKYKIILYYTLQFLVVIFMTYYLTIFCAIYPGSQYSWLIDCLMGMAISTLTLFVVCFIVSLIRSLAVCFKLKHLYYSSVYLEKFI